MIPKVIHYCWFGGNPIPKNVKKYIKSWKKYCPDYEIKLWTEENFDITSHPFMEEAMKSKAWAFVSDYARLKIIYENGGIYLDTDVEVVRNLDCLLENKAFFGLQQPADYVATGLIFAAEKGNIAVKTMIDEYDNINFFEESKRDVACPIINTRALKKLGYMPVSRVIKFSDFTVYPPEYFDPYSVGKEARRMFTKNTYSIHHYNASWETTSLKIKRMVMQTIGQDKVLLIKKILRRMK